MSVNISNPSPYPRAERLLSAAEAASALGLSRNTVYALMKQNVLRHVTVGRRKLVAPSAVEEFIAGHTS